MKKKTLVILVLVICIVAASAVVVFGDFGGEMSIAQRIGVAFKKATSTNQTSGTGDSVAARYGDFVVTWEEIRYQQELAPMRTQKHYQTTDAREIAERLIGGQLALEEAERQGLAATDPEIQEYMQSLRENYETIPEVKAQIDEFCASAGQTLEEYFQTVEEQAYATLTLNRFKSAFYEKWGAEHENEPIDDPEARQEAMLDAYDAYIATLMEQHKDEIEFYINGQTK